MKIVKKELIKINRKLKGDLSRNGSLDFALAMQRNKRIGEYKKLAYLWRAIIVDYPFVDGNKRTDLLLALEFAHQNKKGYNQEKLAKIALKIAKNNITKIH